MKLLTTKTVLGGILGAIGYLSRPDVFAVLPVKVAGIVTTAGMLLTIFGVRHAMAKGGAI